MIAAQDLPLIAGACECADHLLRQYLRVNVAKALRLSTPDEFDRAVALLAKDLRLVVEQPEEGAVQAAVSALDVDWKGTTRQQRQDLVRRATELARQAVGVVPELIRQKLSKAAEGVVSATREDLRRSWGLSIGTEFTALDERSMRFLVKSHTLFVRDRFGRQADIFSQHAREVVARGMAMGHGRDDIAEALAVVARKALVLRDTPYWELVAGSFVGRGRSYGQLGSYAEAGITRYRIEAVLDERTSATCRFLHGKSFAVGDALAAFERGRTLRDGQDVKNVNPWPRRDEHGLYIVRDGQRIDVAQVIDSGVGRRDDLGQFTSPHTEADLSRLGLGFPPYHGLCRTSSTPLV